jgi:hypothetical protein
LITFLSPEMACSFFNITDYDVPIFNSED